MSDGLDGMNEAPAYGDVPLLDAGKYRLKPLKHEMGGAAAIKTFHAHFEILESTSDAPHLQPGCHARMSIWGFGDVKGGPGAQRKLKAYLCALFADAGLTPSSQTDFVKIARQTIADPSRIQFKAAEGGRTVSCTVEVKPPATDPITGQQKNPQAKPWRLFSWL